MTGNYLGRRGEAEGEGMSRSDVDIPMHKASNHISQSPAAVVETIVKLLKEPAESMYRGLSQRAQCELSPQEVRDLRELFSIFCLGSEGRISYGILKRSLYTMGFRINDTELRGTLDDCNVDVTEGVSFPQFVDVVLAQQGDGIDVYEELSSGFAALDIKRTGKITAESLGKVAESLGEELTTSEIDDMILEADRSGTAELSKEDFIQVMLRTNLFRGSEQPPGKSTTGKSRPRNPLP